MNIGEIEKRLIEFEGLRLMPYRCTSNKLTIGVGRNIEDRGISVETAMQMLREDLELVIDELKRAIPGFDKMPETVQEALVDLAFNMGMPTLLTFKRALRALQAQEWDNAAEEILSSRYAKQVGRRAEIIADMIRSGGF
tara:strand:+ start:452 stop:868 length:417 start_codon:yes stop_codon:yes gene_type:complete